MNDLLSIVSTYSSRMVISGHESRGSPVLVERTPSTLLECRLLWKLNLERPALTLLLYRRFSLVLVFQPLDQKSRGRDI